MLQHQTMESIELDRTKVELKYDIMNGGNPVGSYCSRARRRVNSLFVVHT